MDETWIDHHTPNEIFWDARWKVQTVNSDLYLAPLVRLKEEKIPNYSLHLLYSPDLPANDSYLVVDLQKYSQERNLDRMTLKQRTILRPNLDPSTRNVEKNIREPLN